MKNIVSALTLAVVLASFVVAPVASAGDTDAGYREPSQSLIDIADTPPTPWVSLSPNSEQILLLQGPSMPPIEELSEEEVRLAGYRIRPRTFGPSRSRPLESYSILDVASGETMDVKGLPAKARLENTTWSPSGDHVSFTNTTLEGIELWVLDMKKAEARRLTGPDLNLSAQIRPSWIDDEHIAVTMKPEGLGPAPVKSAVPPGPVIQENLGGKAPARTYQDLLKDSHDEALFEYYFASQAARVSLQGKVKRLGEVALIDDITPSPNGEYLLVEALHRPFSYLVPASRFPRKVDVIETKSGDLVSNIADLPLHENIPIAYGSVATGPRSFSWRNDAPAQLVWVEALDGGDAAAEFEDRDQLYLQTAPFDGEPQKWLTLQQRYGGTTWGNGDIAMVSSWWWATRWSRTWVASPDNPSKAGDLLWDMSWQDRYADPGDPETERNEYGKSVLRIEDGNVILLAGLGASDEGDRPFFDSLDLDTKETTRHFRSEAPYYERAWGVLDDDARMLLTRRETVEEVPNYFVRNLDTGELRQLTDFPHPSESLKGMKKELVKYDREDGVQLTATLYTPPGYDRDEDGPLPCLMWAYPTEYKSANDAGQVRDSPYRFDRIGWWSPLLYLTRGYAVLDDPSMPIVGEGEDEPNDTFRKQLVSSAKAACDFVVEAGVARKDAIAIGGHSYGAFMTANLLAHSDLFAAGIARSGAYNRTLTPFGFQSEERSLWQAPEIYFEMSPFMHAEKVNEPILLIHGDSDNNSGTYPMQSERYYNALKGQGATTRLVMLPKESHGYRARESVLHMLYEQEQWLDTYVKRGMETDEPASTH